MDGSKLSTLAFSEVKFPCAVCVSPLGHVFAMFIKICVTFCQVVESNGEQSLVTLKEDEATDNPPTSLCFSSNNSLVVCEHKNENIVELSLK